MASAYFSRQTISNGFKKQNTFRDSIISADLLVIGGGGSGGVGAGSWGGGGGAGGYRTTLDTSPIKLSSGVTYTCKIGGGGTGVIARIYQNTSGSNTYFTGNGITPYIATGGGRGGNEASFQTGGNGGSGGGGNYASAPGTGNIGGYSPVEGYAGASAGSGNNSSGGGGAGAAGSAQTGGVGRNTNSQWATDTSSGVSGYYAGGGGSGLYPAMTVGSGGSGGGGAGSPNGTANGVAGTTNTGSAGGGSNGNGTYYGGSGGSGIIIIRIADSISAKTTTGSPNTYTANGYRYYKFTGDGSITF